MFVKLTRSGPRNYVKLVEAYRDDAGVSCQRVVATLGRPEQVRTGGADALIRGLHRVIDVEEPKAPPVHNAHGAFDAERLLRVMVFNRLCDATSSFIRSASPVWAPPVV